MLKKNRKLKNTLLYFLGILAVLYLINFAGNKLNTKEITYTEFINMLNDKQVEEVVIDPSRITIIATDDNEYKDMDIYTINLDDKDLYKKLDEAGVTYTGKLPEKESIFSMFLPMIMSFTLLFLVGKIMFSAMEKKSGGGVMSFGKNTAKVYAESETGKTFEDVAGQEEAKESLKEIVDFLHNPQKYTEIGAKLPKGALLVGPPGTGKTLLAKAVAGEAKVPFFSLSGSDFVEMFVGMGASRVRDLFKQAEEKAPCIVFIDEIDAIGKSRDNTMSTNDEREQTLNQLLAEMDGFDSSKGVVILAATNRPEILDKALLRPGRFDRRVIVDRPDLKGREAILKVHAKDVKMSEEVNLDEIAKGTPGAVGADLANIVNEGALRAVTNNRKEVLQEDLLEAVEIIIAGKEKKDRILSEKEKQIVAFHEVGHALVAALLANTDPVHKITIVPRTMGALGYTMQLPEEEKYLVSKDEMIDQITVMLGGRAAEEIKFDIITTGASNDIERATKSARSMITQYGMSDKFDMMAFENVQNRYLDGTAVSNCSEQTRTLIDEEILNVIKLCHDNAKKILTDNNDLLNNISNVLLDKETLLGEEFMEIVCGKYPELRKEKAKSAEEVAIDSNEREEVSVEENVNEESNKIEK